jgi:ABC-type transporter Mla MlaB component
MPMHASYIAEELRLDLSFSGNLDVSVSKDICDICRSLPSDLEACIVDISGIDRLFDSGLALLKMLHRHLVKNNVLVVILGDDSEIREHMPTMISRALPLFALTDSVSSRSASSSAEPVL